MSRGKRDSRIDEYIDKAKPFAQPILLHLRKLVHEACPDVDETIKWGMPSFDYKGPFFSMAAFKEHTVFGFWKHKLIKDPNKYLQDNAMQGGSAMGHGGRITSLSDLPPDNVLLDFVLQAKKLNDDGIKLPPKVVKAKVEIPVPDYFLAALRSNGQAHSNFENFSPSKKREYLEWIVEAKSESTRENRMQTAIEWISEGKARNWKYEKSKA